MILVGIKQFVGSKVICEAGLYNAFYYFEYERKVRDCTVVRELIFKTSRLQTNRNYT